MKEMLSKITGPKADGAVMRERLFRLLDQAVERPVLWISAPAGSGKTTLVANWLEAKKLPSLWLQLDEGDNDPAAFFYYLGLAAAKAAPRKKKPLPLLTPEYLMNAPTFSRRYFEELSARFPRSRFVLVLDNYQEVPADSPLHELLLHGIDALPEGPVVIVVSRNEPPPQYARLKANGRMSFLGWNDLRFTLEEVSDVVKTVRRGRCLEMECPGAQMLHEKTDGWAAGIRLVIEATQPRRTTFPSNSP